MWLISIARRVALLFAVVIAPAAQAADTPVGHWVRLGEPAADVPKGLLAYSGMAIDAKGGRLLLFGGGHNDYWGNEVRAFDLVKHEWSKLTEPTPRSRYFETRFDWDNTPGMFPDLRLPVSRHTYDAVEFLDHAGVMFAAGSSTFSGGANEGLWNVYTRGAVGPNRDKGWGSLDVWLFDPKQKTWTYRRPPAEMGDGGNLCAYCPDSKRLVVMRTGSWGGFRGPMLYDVDRDRWEPTKAMSAARKPNTGIHQTAAYDAKRRRVYLVGGSVPADALWAYDVATDAWRELRPRDGSKVPDLRDGAGSAVDAAADTLVTFGRAGTWLFSPSDERWTNLLDVEGPAPQEVFGRLAYDQANSRTVMVVAGKAGVEVWALRLDKTK